MNLTNLPEMDGVIPKSNGYIWTHVGQTKPLPTIDTIIPGDFNDSIDAVVYYNLI